MSERHTILTPLLTREQKELREKEASPDYRRMESRDYRRYEDLLELLLEGYIDKDIKTLDQLCLWFVELSEGFSGLEKYNGEHVLPKIPLKDRESMIGRLVIRAVNERRPESKLNTRPESLKKLVCGLVKLASETDGYVLGIEAKGGADTAFDKVSNMLNKLGVKLSSRSVRKYYQEYK